MALVRSVAAGDQVALHALYERAHRPVFTLIMRITANRETAEELTLDVFHDVWRRASQLRPGERHRARLDHEPGALAGHRPAALRPAQEACRTLRTRIRRSEPKRPIPHDLLAFKQQSEALRSALHVAHARRAAGDRGGVLFGVDVCRGGGTARSSRSERSRRGSAPDCRSSGRRWPRETTP